MTSFKQWLGRRNPITQLVLLLVAVILLIELVGVTLGESVDSLQTRVPGSDKFLHFFGFAALSLGMAAWLRRNSPGVRMPALVVTVFLVCVAAADEAGQAFNPVRNVEMGDLVVGWCGLAVAGACQLWGRRPAIAAALGLTAVVIGGNVMATSVTRQRHLNAAVRHERVGDYAGAEREYLAALAAGADTAGVYNQLGWVGIESGIGDPSIALRHAERALALRPDDPDILDTYGWALHHVGRSAEALTYLERAYAAKPDIFCIHYHLGVVLVTLGQIDKATFHFRQQMKLVNTNEAERSRKALEELQKS